MALKSIALCYQQVHNCTQCKTSSNIAYFSLPLMIKWQILHFYTSKAKLLPGTLVFCMSKYLYNYDIIMICILWLHCIYFLYRHSSSTKYMYTLLLSVKEECCLLKISTWILHFTSCKIELCKLQWRWSFCCVQQNPIYFWR